MRRILQDHGILGMKRVSGRFLRWVAFGCFVLSWVFPGRALASALKPDETVLFLSGLGHQQADGWNLEIHGWVYESEYHKPLTSLFRRAIGIRDDDCFDFASVQGVARA